jgi:MFS family permease
VVQAACQGALAIVLIFIPKTYFETNLFNKTKELEILKIVGNGQTNETVANDNVSMFEYRTSKAGGASKCKVFFANLKLLLRHKVYMISTASVVVLLFIVTAIQYWITDYLTIVIQADRDAITIAFVVTCVTAPTLGIIIGGCIVQRYGGYESKVASLWCVIFAGIAGCCSISIPIFNDIIGFAIVLWLFFFFGGAIVPNIVGIYISSLPIELRGAGNSFSNTLINGFGYLPAPYVYGAVFDATADVNKKISLAAVVNYCWVGVALLALSMYYRYKSFKHQDSVEVIQMKDESGIKSERDRDIDIQFSDVR